MILVFGIVVGLGLIVLTQNAESQSVQAQAPSAAAEARALSWIEFRYGDVQNVFRRGDLTLAQWRAAEPSNTSGLASLSGTEEAHAILIRGAFNTPSNGRWGVGRLVFDNQGNPLNLQFFESVPDAVKAFSGKFDDR
jgi:hypothetical protein